MVLDQEECREEEVYSGFLGHSSKGSAPELAPAAVGAAQSAKISQMKFQTHSLKSMIVQSELCQISMKTVPPVQFGVVGDEVPLLPA